MFTKEYLIEEFINKGRTERELGEEHFKQYGNYGGVSYYLEKYGLRYLKPKYKFKVNESKFSLSSPIFNYYLGLILTDGYIHNKHNYVALCLTNSDAKCILNNLKNHFEFEGEVAEYSYKSGTNIKKRWELRISSDKLIKILSDLGVERGGGKSFSVVIPEKFKSDICARMFFRGILDGDGNIHNSKNKVHGQFRIVKGSVKFIEMIIKYLNKKLNLNCKLTYHKRKGSSYPKLEMSVADSIKFYDWIYTPCFEEFRFEHKYALYLKFKERLG